MHSQNKPDEVPNDASSSQVKQVIVMRKDLNMRKGKIAAQASHVSMMFLAQAVCEQRTICLHDKRLVDDRDLFSEVEREWLLGRFIKVCVGVHDEEELNKIQLAAIKAGLRVHECVDSGATEFKGVSTKTCIAIGPDKAEKIDAVTRHLSLL